LRGRRAAQFLLTSLQGFNVKSVFRLKQMSALRCLFRHMKMKMKMTRTKLVVEFKEFQRLPEWPIVIRSADRQNDSSQKETSRTLMTSSCSEEVSGAQAFAE